MATAVPSASYDRRQPSNRAAQPGSLAADFGIRVRARTITVSADIGEQRVRTPSLMELNKQPRIGNPRMYFLRVFCERSLIKYFLFVIISFHVIEVSFLICQVFSCLINDRKRASTCMSRVSIFNILLLILKFDRRSCNGITHVNLSRANFTKYRYTH